MIIKTVKDSFSLPNISIAIIAVIFAMLISINPFALVLFIGAVVLIALPFFNASMTLLLFLSSVLVLPYIKFGGLYLRFELIYTLYLFVALVLTMSLKKKSSLYIHQTTKWYILYLIAISTASVVSLVSLDIEFNALNLFAAFNGILRPLLIMVIFLNVPLKESFIKKLLWIFIFASFLNSIFTIFQYFNVLNAVQLTEALYSSPFRTPIERMISEYGYFGRAVGFFESPVYNAIYILFAALVCIVLFVHEKGIIKRAILASALLLALFSGIFTKSVTFILGVIGTMSIVGFYYYFRLETKKISVFTKLLVLLIIAIIFASNVYYSPDYNSYMDYQLKRIQENLIFESRYSPESGILSDAYKSIKENLIMGYGIVNPGVFEGDSLYVSVLLRGGIIGFIIFFAFILYILKWTWINAHKSGWEGVINGLLFQITLVLLLIGTGSPSFGIVRLEIWYWALLGVCFNRSIAGGQLAK